MNIKKMNIKKLMGNLAWVTLLLLLSGYSHAVYRWQVADANLPSLQQQLEQYPQQFAGLSLDQENRRVVVRVAKHGQLNSVLTVLDRFTRFEPGVPFDRHSNGRHSKYWNAVLMPVNYSLAELQAVQRQLLTEEPFASRLKPLLVERSIDILNNSVKIGVSKNDLYLGSQLAESFGDRVNLVESTPAYFASRQVAANDGLLAGGARIQRINGGDCTVGFPMQQNSSGLVGFSTAGHCHFGNDTNAFPEQWNSEGDYLGHMLAWRVGPMVNDVFGFTWPEAVDSALVFDYFLSGMAQPVPQAYIGGVNSSTRRFIEGYRDPMLGETVCFSGVKTGENCTAVITDVNVTRPFQIPFVPFPIGIEVSGLTVAQSSNGSIIAQPGDSGGPVYIKQTKGFNEVLTGVGTIQGVNSGPSSTAYMVPISKVPPSGWSMVAAECSWLWVWYICD